MTPMGETQMAITNLDDLYAAMLRDDPEVMSPQDPTAWSADLPVFSDREVKDTMEVWSWDETRMIVGRSNDDLTIIDRGER